MSLDPSGPILTFASCLGATFVVRIKQSRQLGGERQIRSTYAFVRSMRIT